MTKWPNAADAQIHIPSDRENPEVKPSKSREITQRILLTEESKRFSFLLDLSILFTSSVVGLDETKNSHSSALPFCTIQQQFNWIVFNLTTSGLTTNKNLSSPEEEKTMPYSIGHVVAMYLRIVFLK